MRLNLATAGLAPAVSVLAVVALAACGDNSCKLEDSSSCPSDQACEVVQGQEEPACFAPVELHGKVFDLEGGAAIAGAQVSALDVNGSPLGTVAVTNDAGEYVLRVSATRADENGTPIGRKLTLRAAAKDFQSFPSGVRVALPIDTGAAAVQGEEESGPYVLSGGQTDIGLAEVAQALRGLPTIRGAVEVDAAQRGVLVVAEAAGQPGRSAIADSSGEFTVFNVAPGAWSLHAYSRGVNYTPAEVTVEAGKDLSGIGVKRSTVPTGTVKGSADIVSATGATSVVLVVKNTFNEALVRGEVPPGLRAPEPGTVPSISGNFEIGGVPDGDYVVLAAYENDGLVRDPNTNTAGTELQYVTVANGVASGESSFKITDAVQMVSPGAGEAVEETSAQPTFVFHPYPSAKAYDVLVFDTYGNQVWSVTSIPLPTSGDLQVGYEGSALTSGAVYQWRAVARGQAGQPISQTEDLRGVFRVK